MSDIINFINDLFGIESRTTAPIIITLLVFLTGQIIISLKAFWIGIIKRRTTRKLFIEIIREAIKKSRKQEKIFIEISEFVEFDRISDISLTRMQFYGLKFFDDVGFNLVYQSYFFGIENLTLFNSKRSKSKAFYKCIDVLKSVDFWTNASYVKIEELLNSYNEYGQERNHALTNLESLVEKLITNFIDNPKFHEDEYLAELSGINASYQKLKNTKPHIVHEKLIVPLTNLNIQFKANDDILLMNRYLRQASLQYLNMNKVLKTIRKQLFLYSSSFRYNYRVLEKSFETLNRRLCL